MQHGTFGRSGKRLRRALETYWRMAGENPEAHVQHWGIIVENAVAVLKAGGNKSETEYLLKDLMQTYWRCYKRTGSKKFLMLALGASSAIWHVSPVKMWSWRIGCFALLLLAAGMAAWLFASCGVPSRCRPFSWEKTAASGKRRTWRGRGKSMPPAGRRRPPDSASGLGVSSGRSFFPMTAGMPASRVVVGPCAPLSREKWRGNGVLA